MCNVAAVARRSSALLAAAAGLLWLTSAALGAGGATGDAGAIAFYTQAQASYSNVAALRVTRRGYLSYSVQGKTFHWHVSGTPTPAGYKPATESFLVLLKGGRVTKYVDTVKAPALSPLTIIEDANGFWDSLSSHPGACYYKQARVADVLGWGSPLIGVTGKFQPVQHQGGDVIVTSTYPFGSTGTATEVDRISASTKHLISTRIHVAGVPSPFTFTVTDQVIAKPAKILAPTPHC